MRTGTELIDAHQRIGEVGVFHDLISGSSYYQYQRGSEEFSEAWTTPLRSRCSGDRLGSQPTSASKAS